MPQSENDWVWFRRRLYKETNNEERCHQIIKQLTATVSAHPDQLKQHAYILLWQAEVFEKQGKLDEAATMVRQYIKLHPSGRWSSPHVSRVLAASGDHPAALRILHDYIFSQPNHTEPYSLLAVSSAFVGDNELSASSLTRALAGHYGKRLMNMLRYTFFGDSTAKVLKAKCQAEIRTAKKRAMALQLGSD